MPFIFLIKNQHSLIKGLLLMLAMSLPLILRTSSWKLNLDTHVGIFWNISVLYGKRETEYFISEYAWESEIWPHFCQHERRRGDGLLGIWSDSLQQCPGALPFPIFFSFFFWILVQKAQPEVMLKHSHSVNADSASSLSPSTPVEMWKSTKQIRWV